MDDKSFHELRQLKHKRAKLSGNVRKLKTDLGRTSVAVEKHLAVYTAAEVEMKETGKIAVDALNDILLDGDIILFRGNNLGSCVQRCILNAPYDHVAMVIKSPGNPFRNRKPSTYVLEANARDGIHKYDLEIWIYMRTTMNNAFSKVVFRRLFCERTRERRRKLLQFTDRIIGRSYEGNPANFVKAFFEINSKQGDNLSSAFCSKLVAAALQDIGVLSKKHNASIYLPSDFSEKQHGWCGCLANTGKLSKYMLDDAKYGKEIEIDFENSVYNFVTKDKVLDKITEHDMALEICQNIEAVTMIRRWALHMVLKRRRKKEEKEMNMAMSIPMKNDTSNNNGNSKDDEGGEKEEKRTSSTKDVNITIEEKTLKNSL